MEYIARSEEDNIAFLNEENFKYNIELNDIRKIKRELMIKERAISDKVESNNKQIKKYQELIDSKNMFKSFETNEDFKLLNEDELIAISKGIDKFDYTKYGCQRFHDLDLVIKYVINIKKKYPSWILDAMKKQGQYDTLPPKNFYRYTFKTPEGFFSDLNY
jgi:hypothetical protein